MDLKFVPTICPYCGSGCGLYLVTVNGELKGVEPWKRHPVNEGKLCPKGNFCYEFVNHPDRLKKPLIRDEDEFREVSWDELLSSLAKDLQSIVKTNPDSLAFISSSKCTNEDNYVLQKFARTVIGTNNIDNCAVLCHGPSVAGLTLSFGSGSMTNSIRDLEESDCMFIIGANLLEQYPLIGRRMLRAKDNGCNIIVADPRLTPTAIHSDIYLQLYPGTDIALINSMMHVILKEGLEDKKFIASRTKNFEELEPILEYYEPSLAEKITRIPAETIEKAAITFASAENASILYAMGITQHEYGTENVICLANLIMLTGNIGKRGSGLNPLRGQNNVQGACDMGTLPIYLPGYNSIYRAENLENACFKWGCDNLNPKVGIRLVEMIAGNHDDQIKGMYIMGENPVISHPDSAFVKESLQKMDLLVVQDIFMTETAQIADYVIPATCWAEKDGTFTNTERRVQRIRKSIEPPGDALEDWQIISKLAKKMNSSLFEYQSVENIFEEIREVVPQYSGITYQRLERPGGIHWPCLDENDPGNPIIHVNEFKRPDGLGLFLPVQHESQDTVNSDYPFILTSGSVIFHYRTGTMTRRTPTLEKEFAEHYIEINQSDASSLGIKSGDLIKVSTPQGNVKILAKVTPNIIPGVLFIPYHFAEEMTNFLIDGTVLDPISKMPIKFSAAKIEK